MKSPMTTVSVDYFLWAHNLRVLSFRKSPKVGNENENDQKIDEIIKPKIENHGWKNGKSWGFKLWKAAPR